MGSIKHRSVACKNAHSFSAPYIHGHFLQHYTINMERVIDDDDAVFNQLINNLSIGHSDSNDDVLSRGLSSNVLDFIGKKYGTMGNFLSSSRKQEEDVSVIDGFARLKKLRSALAALDKGGWERSYHQRLFHEQFLNAVCRILFKTDPKGTFERAYPRLLEVNNWSTIRQEVLISTPRRFGKTISVCLFVASLMYAAPNLEVSIYSTCKRISCKLLKNCIRYLSIIADIMKVPAMPFIKQTSDEVEIQGPESKYDVRKLNSYPSKVKPYTMLHVRAQPHVLLSPKEPVIYVENGEVCCSTLHRNGAPPATHHCVKWRFSNKKHKFFHKPCQFW